MFPLSVSSAVAVYSKPSLKDPFVFRHISIIVIHKALKSIGPKKSADFTSEPIVHILI